MSPIELKDRTSNATICLYVTLSWEGLPRYSYVPNKDLSRSIVELFRQAVISPCTLLRPHFGIKGMDRRDLLPSGGAGLPCLQ